MRFTAPLLAALLGLAVATSAAAQSVNPFGGFKHDETQPIEIAADELEVREAEQIAVFRGKVDAAQGTLRLNADLLEVHYGDGGAGSGEINRMRAEGEVFIANGAETATGEWAEYDVSGGEIAMGGGVVLTQGGNVVKGARLTIDLRTGRGAVDGGSGRVRSVFKPAPASE